MIPTEIHDDPLAQEHGHFIPQAADSEHVWQLTYQHGTYFQSGYKQRTTTWWLDPLAAIADLNRIARGNWDAVAQLPDVPATPPEDAQLAVNLYFFEGEQAKLSTGTYQLELVANNPSEIDGPVNDTASGTTWQQLKYVFIDSGGDITCLCGNEPSYSGFYMCTPDGRDCGNSDRLSNGHYGCGVCYRIISTDDHGLIKGFANPYQEPVEPTQPEPDRLAVMTRKALTAVINAPDTLTFGAALQAELDAEPGLSAVIRPEFTAAPWTGNTAGVRVDFQPWGISVLVQAHGYRSNQL